MIDELFMKPGQFEFTLKPSTPLAIRSLVQFFGTFIVTAVRINDTGFATPAQITQQSMYSGIIRRRANDMHTFSGPHILAWLGDEYGKGPDAQMTTAGSWATQVTYMFANTSPINGIQLGTYFSAPGTLINSPVYPQKVAPRAVLDGWAAQVGAEYFVSDQGTFFSGAVGATGLFVQTPQVLISDRRGGRDQGLTGLTDAMLTVSEDVDSYATDVYAYGSSGAVGGVGGVSAYRGWSALVPMKSYRDISVNSSSSTDCTNQAATELNRYLLPKQTMSATTTEYAPTRFLVPGDYVWVYRPESGVYDTTNPINFRGETIFPQKVRCVGVRWPLLSGMGVYLISSDANRTVTDITDWVQWETSATSTVALAALQRPLATVFGKFQYS